MDDVSPPFRTCWVFDGFPPLPGASNEEPHCPCHVRDVVACRVGSLLQPAPPADNVDKNQKAPATAAAAPANNTRVEQGVTFSVEPANVYACEGRDRTTSVVKWDVQRPDVNSVKVLVSDSTNPEKKTLAVMSPKGEAKTGEWVIAGLLVELVDAESGKQLATHTVTALPCN
ncbi:MAG: hypothetical protein IPO74_06700 [Thermomonas sp.]|nr:hypothetical protein [Thermomonas sp.]